MDTAVLQAPCGRASGKGGTKEHEDASKTPKDNAPKDDMEGTTTKTEDTDAANEEHVEDEGLKEKNDAKTVDDKTKESLACKSKAAAAAKANPKAAAKAKANPKAAAKSKSKGKGKGGGKGKKGKPSAKAVAKATGKKKPSSESMAKMGDVTKMPMELVKKKLHSAWA